MKVALINGQNHRGSTYHIGRMLAEELADNSEITEIFVPRDMPEFCTGCTACVIKDERLCPHFKYIEPITKIIDSSDVLIFTTPVYVLHCSGSMKALLDHFAYRWMVHRPEKSMFSKQAVCISTAAGAGMKSACKDIKHSLFFWGAARIYTYGTAVAATSWNGVKDVKKQSIEKRVKKLAGRILSKQSRVHPSILTKALFIIMKQAQKRGWNPADAAYWKENAWMDGKKPWKA